MCLITSPPVPGWHRDSHGMPFCRRRTFIFYYYFSSLSLYPVRPTVSPVHYPVAIFSSPVTSRSPKIFRRSSIIIIIIIIVYRSLVYQHNSYTTDHWRPDRMTDDIRRDKDPILRPSRFIHVFQQLSVPA